MTKKDLNFLVEVRIQKSEGDDTVFFVTLGQLHDAIVTHPSGLIYQQVRRVHKQKKFLQEMRKLKNCGRVCC